MSSRLSLVVTLSTGIAASSCGGSCPKEGHSTASGQPVASNSQGAPSQGSGLAHTPTEVWNEPMPSSPASTPAPTPTPAPAPAPTPAPAPAPTPTPAPAPAPASTLHPAFQQILDRHNQLRARHCAGPLSWSDQLAAVAQDWADTLAANSCAFEHRPRNRFGENLTFFAPVGSQSPGGVAQGWYNEVQQYDFNKGDFDFHTGHFTQVVWRGSTELGCGVSQCNGGVIWVCNYNPPGNMMGDFQRNVLHPSQCSK